jgi:hypothetical protein
MDAVAKRCNGDCSRQTPSPKQQASPLGQFVGLLRFAISLIFHGDCPVSIIREHGAYRTDDTKASGGFTINLIYFSVLGVDIVFLNGRLVRRLAIQRRGPRCQL